MTAAELFALQSMSPVEIAREIIGLESAVEMATDFDDPSKARAIKRTIAAYRKQMRTKLLLRLRP